LNQATGDLNFKQRLLQIMTGGYMREYNYGTIFIGAQKIISPRVILGLRLSLIKGGYYQNVNIEKGSLYLSESAFM